MELATYSYLISHSYAIGDWLFLFSTLEQNPNQFYAVFESLRKSDVHFAIDQNMAYFKNSRCDSSDPFCNCYGCPVLLSMTTLLIHSLPQHLAQPVSPISFPLGQWCTGIAGSSSSFHTLDTTNPQSGVLPTLVLVRI